MRSMMFFPTFPANAGVIKQQEAATAAATATTRPAIRDFIVETFLCYVNKDKGNNKIIQGSQFILCNEILYAFHKEQIHLGIPDGQFTTLETDKYDIRPSQLLNTETLSTFPPINITAIIPNSISLIYISFLIIVLNPLEVLICFRNNKTRQCKDFHHIAPWIEWPTNTLTLYG